MKIFRVFYLKIFSFWRWDFSIYLNRCVFVMPRNVKMSLTGANSLCFCIGVLWARIHMRNIAHGSDFCYCCIGILLSMFCAFSGSTSNIDELPWHVQCYEEKKVCSCMPVSPCLPRSPDHMTNHVSRNSRKRNFRYWRPAKIQIRLRIFTVWSETLLGAG